MRRSLRKRSIYSAESSVEFVPTGCTALDLVLGGGWALGRVANIVGDKSTGKTLLAIECIANFRAKYRGNCRVVYNETEAAFDAGYAQSLGIPLSDVEMLDDCGTVEGMYDNIHSVIADNKDKDPVLYIVDSLDALSDETEMGRDIRDGTYGMGKQKKLSELFRRLVREMHGSNMLLLVISQVRANIGVAFGSNVRRSGGKALDFYASQVLFLHHKGRITKTIDGVKREVGVDIRAKCEKNKVGMPLRYCEFPILFGYGIDDVVACLRWLEDNKLLDANGMSRPTVEIKRYRAMNDQSRREYSSHVSQLVRDGWGVIEEKFRPVNRKYD